MSKRYSHSSSQRRAASTFLSQSDILADAEFLEQCHALMENTVVEAGMIVVGALLESSVRRLVGEPHQGKAEGEFYRHGYQPGSIYLGGNKVRIDRPRVRSKLGVEASIPAYELLSSDEKAGRKVMRAAMAGVSTRKYGKAIEDAAEVAGISKSNISRRLIEQTASELVKLMERPVPADTLVLMLDGIHMGEQVAIGAVGIDSSGKKHSLGVADGTTENASVVGDLLRSLVDRGLDIGQKILFLTDGSKAIRSAILQICGSHHEIQRCREHKIRNVTDRLPKTKVSETRAAMRAAWKLPYEKGMAKMRLLARELAVSHPDAARSLLEGLEDTFTLNRLGLPPLLVGSLQSTNISESVNSVLRTITGRIKNFQGGNDQVRRWAAAGLLEVEKSFRLIKGHNQLWMLEAALGRNSKEEAV